MDTLEVKMTVDLVAFDVPQCALVVASADADDETTCLRIPIEDLEPEALEALASRWLDNLFAAAQRQSPFKLPTRDRAA